MWDLDGNEYVDALNGFGMNLFGWQPTSFIEAVRKQLDSGYDIGPQHPLAGEVAKLMCELTGFDRAALCNTGSEAVMGCVRIARTVTGRSKIAMFNGAYHGIFDEVIVRGTKKLRSHGGAGHHAQHGRERRRARLRHARDAAMAEATTPTISAAVLVEPVQSRRPDFQPRVPARAARPHREAGTAADLRRGRHRLPQPPGRHPGAVRHPRRLGLSGKVVGGGFRSA